MATKSRKTPPPKKTGPSLIARLAGEDEVGELSNQDINKRLALFMLLLANVDMFERTFPSKGGINTKGLEDAGFFTKGEIPEEPLETLAKDRNLFLLMQLIWKKFAEYSDPPCPDGRTYEKLVDFMKNKLHTL